MLRYVHFSMCPQGFGKLFFLLLINPPPFFLAIKWPVFAFNSAGRPVLARRCTNSPSLTSSLLRQLPSLWSSPESKNQIKVDLAHLRKISASPGLLTAWVQFLRSDSILLTLKVPYYAKFTNIFWQQYVSLARQSFFLSPTKHPTTH